MDKKYLVEEKNDALYIKLYDYDNLLDSISVDYPDCGYGGYDIIENPTGDRIVLSMYSGQADFWFVVFTIKDNKFDFLIEEPVSYGVASFMWSDDGNKLVQLVDSYSFWDANNDGSYPVGYVNIFDINYSYKETKQISYDFTDYDMNDIDFFTMNLEKRDGIIVVQLPCEREFKIV